MIDIKQLVRPNILELKAYASARDEYKGTSGTFLDANENPFGKLNRYPDPLQKHFKAELSKSKNTPIENIFIGNGSDEVIDLAVRIFCVPGKDKVVVLSPTYGMYSVTAKINDIDVIDIPLDKTFQIDHPALKNVLQDSTVKIIFICSPNNPTGNSINDIEFVLNNFKGIVLLDEAYIDFCRDKSWLRRLALHPNLIISQTMSKAWGLAAARIGIAYAHPDIIQLFNKIKPPYNVSSINQVAAVNALASSELYQKRLEIIQKEKVRLLAKLKNLNCVTKVYPSDANFLLVEVNDADHVYRRLVEKEIITRNRNTVIQNCIRITVGTPKENTLLIKALKEIA